MSDPDEPTVQELIAIYETSKTIAVVGASADDSKPSHTIPAYLQAAGYRIIPVNPREASIFGERAYASLGDIGEPIDVVDVFRRREEAEAVARDAVSAGAKVLWFQPGTETDEAVAIARDAELTVVTHRCMGATHEQLGLGRP
jgi:uncharacterized protein